ncbi:MAG: hypothetical protein LCH76_10070 [Actinobacteria bacterium]|nr:hypothetical protein [Actinomycetota bacterium]
MLSLRIDLKPKITEGVVPLVQHLMWPAAADASGLTTARVIYPDNLTYVSISQVRLDNELTSSIVLTPPGACLIMDGMSAPVQIVRIKLGDDRPAPQPDPLGRDRVGYVDGLTTSELWERGRGVWKARLATVAEADLAVLVARGTVQLVGTIDGVTFHGDRVAIEGRPLPQHPLTGQPDPLPNRSQNPIAYGTVTTVPTESLPDDTSQASYADLLTDAVDALTAAARWRRPTLRKNAQDKWEPDPDHTEPGDWAEFVTLSLAGTAANVGGIEAALAGRPGSWEAEGVRQLLHSTVGVDEEQLWQHRTEPLEMTIYVDELLVDVDYDLVRAYEEAYEEVRRRYEAAEQADPEPDYDRYLWTYDRTETGDFVARAADAPAWSWDAWRSQPARPGERDFRHAIEDSLRAGAGSYSATAATIAKGQNAAEELWRLEDAREERLNAADLEVELEQLRLRELRAYGEALKARIEDLAADLPGLQVPIHITVDVTTFRSGSTRSTLETVEDRLLNLALESTPTPSALPGTPLDRLLRSVEEAHSPTTIETHLMALATDGEIQITLHDSDAENYGDQLADQETIPGVDTTDLTAIENALSAAGYRVAGEGWQIVDGHYSARVEVAR